MTKVIGVRFKSSGRIYYFDPLEFDIKTGDGVIVETARGQEFGDVAHGVMDVDESQVVQPLKPVIRVATEEDRSMREANAAKEGDAFQLCQQKIAQHKLDMKLVDVEYAFNGSKVVFYFTADERVDFRELVKDLAAQFRTRIELRQIGVRDEAKMLGGLGSCGRPVCCKAFLDDFRPVSIKMAKEQNLSLSPTKISGLCGRLMCCLQYEQSAYEDMKRRMPRINSEVLTPDGQGIAVENNVITEKTRVRLTLADGSIEMRHYHYEELAKPGDPLPKRRQPEPKEAPAYDGPTPNVSLSSGGSEEPGQQANGQQASGQQNNKRRRRGGRGHGGAQGVGSPNAVGASKQQPDKQPAKAQPAAQPPKPPVNGQNGGSAAPGKRRRRGGHKPKPQTPAQ